MKLSTIGAVLTVTVLGAAASASTTSEGYDPLALDHFINAALTADSGAMPSGVQMMQSATPTVVAQQTQRFDAQGYLIGPDGQRIKPKLLLRWNVGVFR